MTRRFVVVGHTQSTTLPLRLDDPAGQGRWDVFCRCVANAFLLSDGIRKDTEVFLVLPAATRKTIWLKGDELQHLNPDERSIFGLLANTLAGTPVSGHPWRVTPGCYIANWGLDEVLARLQGSIVFLEPHAPAVPFQALPKDPTFVLSDHEAIQPEEREAIERSGNRRMPLGPTMLHAASCITILHFLGDAARQGL